MGRTHRLMCPIKVLGREDSHDRAELGPTPLVPTPTHEAVAHDAAEALEGVTVSVGEVELGQLRVSEQGAQCGL